MNVWGQVSEHPSCILFIRIIFFNLFSAEILLKPVINLITVKEILLNAFQIKKVELLSITCSTKVNQVIQPHPVNAVLYSQYY
jgi:hypothetical protein